MKWQYVFLGIFIAEASLQSIAGNTVCGSIFCAVSPYP